MDVSEVLLDGLGRVRDGVHYAVDGLDDEDLVWRPDPDANSIAWLVWHLTRVQDDHIADVAGVEQRWTADGWAARFDLPFPVAAHGYGHTSADVGEVRAPGDLLTGYHHAVHDASAEYVSTLTPPDLDRVVDTRWDPPVTLGVRLVSVTDDCLEHVGQARYARGLLERR